MSLPATFDGGSGLLKRPGTWTGVLTLGGDGLRRRPPGSALEAGGGLLDWKRPLPGSKAGTDLARLDKPSGSVLWLSGLFSSLIFCSQKEKRDENAMLADQLS